MAFELIYTHKGDEHVESELKKRLKSDKQCYKKVVLCGNNITRIPPLSKYKQFAGIETLHLYINEIVAVDVSCVPKSTRDINLSINNIRELPNFSLHSLYTINLQCNKITTIDITNFPHSIRDINLGGNSLKYLPDFSVLDNLQELHLGSNNITEIKVDYLPWSLEELHLDNNKISTVPSLVKLTKLKTLILHQNNITVIHGLPVNLKNITLKGNPLLQDLKQDCFPNNSVYKRITVECDLSYFQKDILQPEQISALCIYNWSPPGSVLQDSYEAVIEYFTEKETKEEGEKLSHTSQTTVCEGSSAYTDLCEKFKKTLQINEKLFEPEQNMCYCTSCHTGRMDDKIYQRGQPKKSYAMPVHWFRFGLVAPPKVHELDAFDKWHRAYHGTKVDKLKPILQIGDIVPAGMRVLGGAKVREREGHFDDKRKPEGFDTKRVFVTPSIVYAGHEAYATSSSFKDPDTNIQYKAQVAFQVLIHPDSYEVGKQTVGAKDQIDPLFENGELEWATAEHGAVIIYGLLVKLTQDQKTTTDRTKAKEAKPTKD